jgi:hypothetical protein
VTRGQELAQGGMPISAAGVRWVGKRPGVEKLNNRLRAWEAQVARESHLLTEAHLAAVAKAQVEKDAPGAFESAWPGSCGAQETCYVGTGKGGGRLYQHPFLATSSQVAAAQLDDRKTALPAADCLHDPVVPFFEAQAVPLSRILPDRGTASCGSPDRQE